MTVHREQIVKSERKPTRCNSRCLLSTSVSTCFGHHYANLQENKTFVTARGVLRWFCWMWLVAVVGRCVVRCEHCEGYSNLHSARWFCWMWLVAVVGRCVVGCEHCEGYSNLHSARWFCWMWLVVVVGRCLVGCELTFTVLAPHNAAPHNHYQPHPAEPAQHTTCSNTRLGPEHGHNDARDMLRKY